MVRFELSPLNIIYTCTLNSARCVVNKNTRRYVVYAGSVLKILTLKSYSTFSFIKIIVSNNITCIYCYKLYLIENFIRVLMFYPSH